MVLAEHVVRKCPKTRGAVRGVVTWPWGIGIRHNGARATQKSKASLHFTPTYVFVPIKMPSSRKSPRPTSSRSATRTGIIVGVIVGVLALLIIAYILIARRRRQGVKAGTKIGVQLARTKQDKDLEVGVIQEPVPVYQKELRQDEKRLAMGMEAEVVR